MIAALLNHKNRKELIRNNKKHNHKEYLRALQTGPKIKYWAGYHKKKLIFLALVALVGWTYDYHITLYHSILSLRSPRQFMNHMLFGDEKIEKTVHEQKIVGWPFDQTTFDLLTKLFYETDKRLIFGVGRNYLFQVYSDMGLLQKQQDIKKFWIGGGFYKKRNQLVSGVSYQQFIGLYAEGFKTLKKTTPELTQQEFHRKFLETFIQKGPEIVSWQKQYNKKRYNEFLKNLISDSEKKTEHLNQLMKDNIEISEEEIEQKLLDIGMKGLGIKDKWLYWRNRQILYSMREYTVHNRLNLHSVEGRERQDLENKLRDIEKELSFISEKKNQLKTDFKDIYDDDLL